MAKELTPFTGKDLAALRARHGLDRPQLMEAIGVHRNTLMKIENENLEVPLQMRLALAAFEAELKPITRSRGR